MEKELARLSEILAELDALGSAAAVLLWDQETYMPPGGAQARARHRSTLARLAHERFTSPEVGDLLASLADGVAGLDPTSYEASLVRVTRRQYERATRLPSGLVAELARVTSLAQQAWQQARAAADFSLFRPHLQRIVALTIEKAEHLGYSHQRYDALLDLYEPELPTSQVAGIFAELKSRLVPLVQSLAGRGREAAAAVLGRPFDPDRQWELGMRVLAALGFDLRRGRQDRSAHPFTVAFSPGDVRITTRINPQDPLSGLLATIHEAGHGIHAQGIPESLAGTPLGESPSLGIGESQSRLWENLVGRSLPFWEHFYPLFQEAFPSQLAGVPLERFYQAVNRVEPSLIRVDADEVTYNLHIFLRFELEQALIRGELDVAALPGAWNEKVREYLGLTPPDDAQGVLQDTHWASGAIGYFPTYALGTVLSVQFYEQALAECPDIPAEMRRGRFDTLRLWTREKIHVHGAKFTPAELVEKVTGRPLDSEPYLRYLERKYGELFGI